MKFYALFQILFLMQLDACQKSSEVYANKVCDVLKTFDSEYAVKEEDIKSIKDEIKDVMDFNANFTYNFNELLQNVDARSANIEQLDIRYILFTQENKNKPESVSPTGESLKNSKFNNIFPTVFFIHGSNKKQDFMNSLEATVKDFLLQKGSYNIFYVDFIPLNQGKYIQTITNGFLVARHIKMFLTVLFETTEVKEKDLHIIGISLGAEIAGMVGFMFQGIGRITGLDPVDKVFGRMPNEYKLDSTDADFVDIIHTSAKEFPEGFGLSHTRGHVNFYPNGGESQPGCKHATLIKDNLKTGSIEVIEFVEARCSHIRSIYYFLESICSTDCQFVSVKCDNYQNFLSNRCNKFNSITALMGFPAKKISLHSQKTKFYLKTNNLYPFCIKSCA